METFHAIPEKVGKDRLEKQRLALQSNTLIIDLINAFPYIIAILNENRQLVFHNEALANQLGIKNFYSLFGYRPGEVLKCIHSHEVSGGCGASESCRYCGAVNTIIKSLKENRAVSNECRIFAEIEGKETAYDFLVSSKPFTWESERFLIFTLTDISGEKRRQMLERIFFHDILNTAGNLRNIADLLPSLDDSSQKDEFLQIMRNLSSELVEEIEAQRQISIAEAGELIPRFEPVNSREIIESLLHQFRNRMNRVNALKVSENTEDISFLSDRSLVIRILKNMVINALEASPESDNIRIHARIKGSVICFEVSNPAYIPRDIQLQIFNRSFSTKSIDRGFGTYSMKLLGERYLKGKVYFTSSEPNGTVFSFELPLSQK